ncbi:MAG: hypothetical protein JOZ21_14065 [Verrucomicrobia bacterium]|nr:hypothetical protein [Verrucomicrobiota bacterium]
MSTSILAWAPRPCIDQEPYAGVTMSSRLNRPLMKFDPMKLDPVPVFMLLTGSLALNACQSGKPDPDAAAYAAVAAGTGDDFRAAVRDHVKLYQSGPQQITGPDALLQKGTLVRMVRRALGYSLVQTVEGNQLGWVANEDLGRAPETAADR